MRKIALIVAALCLTGTSAAEARPTEAHHAKVRHHKSLCERAYVARVKVIHLHGKRAPGRNICRFGVVTKHGVRDATVKEKGKYLLQLRVLARPAPAYLSRNAVPPSRAPAGVLSSSYGATGVAACIISRESGGNPTATNGQYGGIAQWSPEAWSRMHGTRYASTPQGATYQQQLQVLSYGLSHYGTGDWKPYDGCG